MTDEFTVAKYLQTRLEELGLGQMFGVAGNYTAALLDTILADPESTIKISGNANEICAGFAADAYARTKGIGAVYVTYSVGAFTALNPIAGSFVERVPVILINGAPTAKEVSNEEHEGLLYSHTTGYQNVDIDVFRPVTAAAERVTNAIRAPLQIDSVLTTMIREKQPVYLEVAEDVWRAPCRRPSGSLNVGGVGIITVSEARQAAEKALEHLEQHPNFIVWAGVELQRFHLHDQFLELMQTLNRGCEDSGKPIRFVTSPLSKGVVSENHPLFDGCVTLKPSEIEALVGPDGCLFSLGGWTTSKNTGSRNIRGANTLFIGHDDARIGSEFFPSVRLDEFISEFLSLLEQRPLKRQTGLRLPRHALAAKPAPSAQSTSNVVDYDDFFNQLGGWLTGDDVLVVDAGFPLIGSQGVPIVEANGFLAQAAWLSIGYSVPAATGVKCARPDKRVMVVVGDGAFHETCQAVSDQHAYGHNTVVFVLKNGLYGIEQFIVNPNPFREPPVQYSSKLENAVYPYNALASWEYDKVVEAFGGEGRKAQSVAQLQEILGEIRRRPEINFVVEVTIPEVSLPSALRAEVDTSVGEDEIDNPNWPPASKF